MTRTQIYLPDEQHLTLHQIAKAGNTSFSQLIREGADLVIKKRSQKLRPQSEFWRLLFSYPDKSRVKLSKSSEQLIREERD
jgi:hypothetical protein